MHTRRSILKATASASVIALLGGCTTLPRREPFDAAVGTDDIDAPRFATLQSAIASAPPHGTRPFRILVANGRFHERLVIDKPHIHLIGASRAGSVITHDTAAGTPGPDGKPVGTWGCATVRVLAPDFAARNLTIENAFDYLGHLRAPVFEQIGSNGAQAVALMLDRGSDRALLDDVELVGHQDTLFADAGRSLFRDCRVRGSVDFVFGAGQAVFERCELQSRFRPDKPRQGYVAVPSTSASADHGLTFRRCRLTREAEVPDGSVALGRPWRPTRDFPDGRYGDPDAVGLAVYLQCWMDAHVAPEGWDPMNTTARDGRRVPVDPADARLFEFESTGPGAHAGARRPALTPAQAAMHATDRVLGDWTPARR